MNNTILIFPAGMVKALEFKAQMRTENKQVIGASSIRYDSARQYYTDWVYLPHITEPGFESALCMVIEQHKIDTIYTPNTLVWHYLKPRIESGKFSIRLLNNEPQQHDEAPYLRAMNFAKTVLEQPLPLAISDDIREPLSALELAALFRHAETIPGMCNHDKIWALCQIFRSAPEGDIIEIGSLWGKSAFILLYLARQYQVGKVLCVDPWSVENGAQEDKTGLLSPTKFDIDLAFNMFLINLLPYVLGNFNYLRTTSASATDYYQPSCVVKSESFGQTCYQGQVAILHIDGNHDYVHTKQDIEKWIDHVKPGGWVIFDDYHWPYGDGPKQAVDEYIVQSSHECAFVIDRVMFVRKK